MQQLSCGVRYLYVYTCFMTFFVLFAFFPPPMCLLAQEQPRQIQTRRIPMHEQEEVFGALTTAQEAPVLSLVNRSWGTACCRQTTSFSMYVRTHATLAKKVDPLLIATYLVALLTHTVCTRHAYDIPLDINDRFLPQMQRYTRYIGHLY